MFKSRKKIWCISANCEHTEDVCPQKDNAINFREKVRPFVDIRAASELLELNLFRIFALLLLGHSQFYVSMISICINGTSHAVPPALLAGEDLRYFIVCQLVQAKIDEGKNRMTAYRSVARISGISCRHVRRIFTEYQQAHHE